MFIFHAKFNSCHFHSKFNIAGPTSDILSNSTARSIHFSFICVNPPKTNLGIHQIVMLSVVILVLIHLSIKVFKVYRANEEQFSV